MIDLAIVNGFILFQEYRTAHPEIVELGRPSGNVSHDNLGLFY
jgi:hypothetical protein